MVGEELMNIGKGESERAILRNRRIAFADLKPDRVTSEGVERRKEKLILRKYVFT